MDAQDIEAGAVEDGKARAVTGLVAVAGLLGALAATSCCILPIVLFTLGISGAWIGNFTELAPYQPVFIAATVACLGSGYWMVHRSTRRACVEGGTRTCPLPSHIVKGALYAATALVIAAVAFNFIGPYLLA